MTFIDYVASLPPPTAANCVSYTYDGTVAFAIGTVVITVLFIIGTVRSFRNDSPYKMTLLFMAVCYVVLTIAYFIYYPVLFNCNQFGEVVPRII